MRSRLAVIVALVASPGVLVVSASPGAGQPAAPQASSSQAEVQRPARPGNGVTFPKLLKQVQPVYTEAARRAGIQGAVELEAIIEADGIVGDVRVVKSLDQRFGLDDQAVIAARQWRFEPGLRQGTPVPTIVTLILEYRLRSDGRPTSTPPAPATQTIAPQGVQDDEFTKGAYAETTPGLVMPRVIRSTAPKYTSDAMRAKIQGIVEVEAVVMPDGTVGRARIATSLDKVFGLDQEALAAAAKWTFEPGTLNGQSVPVLIKFNLEFRLH